MFTLKKYCDETFTPLSVPTLEEAVGHARSLVRAEPNEPVYIIFDPDDQHVATVTHRRIEARFYKQRWKDDHLESVDTVKFDATDYVLLLPYEEINEGEYRHFFGRLF